MVDSITCPSCRAEIEAQSKICRECGAEVPSPPRPTRCPNTACGKALKGQEKFCPACGTKIETVPQVGRIEDALTQQKKLQQKIWTACKNYLDKNPQGKHAYDARIIAEITKASMAFTSITLSKEIDYSLFNMDLENSFFHLCNLQPEVIPEKVEIPNKVKAIYISVSLDTDEFRNLAAKICPGIELDTAGLEKKRNGILSWRLAFYEKVINDVLNNVKSKYEGMLINGKTKALVEKITMDELYNEAEIYYKALTNKNYEKAKRGFEKLAGYNPLDSYFHNVLYAIYYEMKDYKRAFEETIYAGSLQDDWMDREGEKEGGKRDINIISNRANFLRQLGLHPALLTTLRDRGIEEEFKEDSETQQYMEIYFDRRLAFTVGYGLANVTFFDLLRKGKL